MILFILSLVLTAAAGICWGVMQTLMWHYDNSIFRIGDFNQSFWNPDISYANKWKSSTDLTPKYWGSSTIFVWTTDGFHLLQFFMIHFLFIAFILYGASGYHLFSSAWSYFAEFIIYKATFSLGFEGTWRLLYRK